MSMKFGLLIYVDLQRRVQSTNMKPEVWSRRVHRLDKIWDLDSE